MNNRTLQLHVAGLKVPVGSSAACPDARRRKPEPRRSGRHITIAGILLVIVSTSGCGTIRERITRHNEDEIERLADTDDVQGPMQRLLGRIQQRQSDTSAIGFSPETQRELDAADRLRETGDVRRAARDYKRIAKKYAESAAGEEAQFKLGELHFKQERYAKAQDAYDQLFQDYPSTRYTDQVTRRLFVIAGNWLDFPSVATPGDVRQASFNRDGSVDAESPPPQKPPRDITRRIAILPNFHDRTRPVFDTRGRGRQALRSIWLNDPTGPLADDALMLTASHYLRKGDYVESDRYYQILREEYPRSPHLENAFVLGSHVKLMSYQGAEYEGNTLEATRQLKESTLRLFPDNEHRQRIRAELDKVAEAQAQRDWVTVEFYQKKGRPRSVAVYCQQVIERYPDSSYARRARETLDRINPQALTELPGFRSPDRQIARAAEPPPTADDPDSDTAEVDEPAPPRRFRLFQGRK